MLTVLRALRLLALIVWLGGLIFFGAVLAPVAFTHLATTHDAGLVVGASLRILHIIGFVCGAVLILTTLALDRTGRAVGFTTITIAMLALTAWSQFSIIPRMESDRLAAGEITPSCISPACTDFNRLHPLSEHVEEAVMLGGLVLTVMLAQRED
ncbi:MAG TPA: DUF4149 domain-containing protein [Acidobacteriaceae bacterium]|jgi:uncharacterized membrane protein|nr:DUF4149 domain-containing protein [Acidobacteriaceae bacterium]